MNLRTLLPGLLGLVASVLRDTRANQLRSAASETCLFPVLRTNLRAPGSDVNYRLAQFHHAATCALAAGATCWPSGFKSTLFWARPLPTLTCRPSAGTRRA